MTNKEGESLKPLAKSANSQELMISFKQWIWCKHCYCYSLHATSVYRCSVQELYWLWVHSEHTLGTLRDHSEKTWRTVTSLAERTHVPRRVINISLKGLSRSNWILILIGDYMMSSLSDVKKVLLGAGQATAAFVSELHICSPWSGLAASDNGKRFR